MKHTKMNESKVLSTCLLAVSVLLILVLFPIGLFAEIAKSSTRKST